MFRKNKLEELVYYTSPVFEKYNIKHFFASRFGGVSGGAFDSLNVSLARKDENGYTDAPENVLENYKRALEIVGVNPENACAARQVHSCDVKRVTNADAGFGIIPERQFENGFDATLLDKNTENVDALCVKTADCVPILLANLKTGSVAAVHAGWRGTVSDIAVKSAKMLGDPCDIAAAIGPCIGMCCYQVGDEVYQAVKRLFAFYGMENLVNNTFAFRANCSADTAKHANLAEINRLLLINAGLKEQNVDVSGLCTCCARDEHGRNIFFSHRGYGGHSGTFVSGIRKL